MNMRAGRIGSGNFLQAVLWVLLALIGRNERKDGGGTGSEIEGGVGVGRYREGVAGRGDVHGSGGMVDGDGKRLGGALTTGDGHACGDF